MKGIKTENRKRKEEGRKKIRKGREEKEGKE